MSGSDAIWPERHGSGGMLAPAILFVGVFAVASYALMPRAAAPAPAQAIDQPAAPPPTVRRLAAPTFTFAGCNAARAAGRENIPIGDPAYHPRLDGDGDGLACEPLPPRTYDRARPRVRVWNGSDHDSRRRRRS